MKKTILSTMVLAAIALTSMPFSSCKKDSKTTTPSAGSLAKGKSSVTATISGAFSRDYTSNVTLSSVASSTGIVNIATANSSALGGGGPLTEQFVILLPANITTGAHNTEDVDVKGTTFSYTKSDGATATGWATGDKTTSVNFNVTKSTAEEIEGTFEGTLGNDTDNTKVTVKGTFAAKL